MANNSKHYKNKFTYFFVYANYLYLHKRPTFLFIYAKIEKRNQNKFIFAV